MFTISVANQKGGVAKSTTCVNLGVALAEAGFPTLLVDLDPSAGLTRMIDRGLLARPETSYTFLQDPLASIPRGVVVPADSVPNLSLIPANENLVGSEKELLTSDPINWHQTLRKSLAPLASQFSYVLVDCPPGRAALVMIGIASSDALLVPMETEFIALAGVPVLEQVVRQVREINPRLQRRVLRTKYDGRTRHHREIFEEVEKAFPGEVFTATIPYSVKFPDSTIAGKSIIHFDAAHKGAQAYRELAEELIAIWPSDRVQRVSARAS